MPDVATEAERRQELRLLADSVAAFAAGRLPLTRTRRLRGQSPEFEADMMGELAGQGWLGLLLPEELGGFGLGFSAAREAVCGLAAQLAPEPFVPVAVLAAGALRRCAAGVARDALISDLAAGKAAPALAWQGAGGGLDAERPAFQAERARDTWTVAGEARFIRPGSGASHYLLAAAVADGLALFVVPPGTSGLQVVSEPQADGTALARVRASGLSVDRAACLPLSAADFAAAIDEAVLMNAVELLALIRRMRAMTLDYLKTRVQFGKPIGSFQALQHRAVDLLLHEELASAAIDQAVSGFDGGVDARTRASLASRAKARAGEAAAWVARESIQMHGGIGVTDEYDLSLFVNRTLSLASWLGSARAHRQRWLRLNPPSLENAG
jgi:alkylation response protein AidB-like acyl-CoA dehydrogenase